MVQGRGKGGREGGQVEGVGIGGVVEGRRRRRRGVAGVDDYMGGREEEFAVSLLAFLAVAALVGMLAKEGHDLVFFKSKRAVWKFVGSRFL
jgi:hypothetical protein